MVTACLEHSKTFAHLACFLAGPPHDDIGDYDRLMDEFIEAMQSFQETYQKVRHMKDSRDTGEVEVEEEVEEEPTTPFFHATPSPCRTSHSSLDGTQGMLDSSEDTLGEMDELESMGSQDSNKQWDSVEDSYLRAQVSLVADLQDPLFEQLHKPLADSLVAPLLEELTSPLEERLAGRLPARLATCPELLETLTASLTQHTPLLDTLAARLHEHTRARRASNRVAEGAQPTMPALQSAHATAPSQVALCKPVQADKRHSAPTTHKTPTKKLRSDRDV